MFSTIELTCIAQYKRILFYLMHFVSLKVNALHIVSSQGEGELPSF